MKKALMFFMVVFAVMASSAAAMASNDFRVNNSSGGSGGTVTVNFTDHTSQMYDIGTSSSYSYNIGTKVAESVTINGTTIPAGQSRSVVLTSGITVTATVQLIQVDRQKLDSILQLIR